MHADTEDDRQVLIHRLRRSPQIQSRWDRDIRNAPIRSALHGFVLGCEWIPIPAEGHSGDSVPPWHTIQPPLSVAGTIPLLSISVRCASRRRRKKDQQVVTSKTNDRRVCHSAIVIRIPLIPAGKPRMHFHFVVQRCCDRTEGRNWRS